MDWLVEPFRHGFMQNAFAAAVLVSLTCATAGIYVVLRRMAFIGGAIAHTVLPGLVVAFLRGWSLFGGALVAGIVTALGIGWISRRGLVREDTAIGVFFTAMFALGIAIFSVVRTFRDLFALLFGDILAISPPDLILLAIIAAVVLGVLALFHKELELTSVDPTHAAALGLNPDRVRYGLLLLLALAVVAGIQAVGIILTSALLVTPAAAATLLSDRLPRMLATSVAIAIVASVTGLYASFYLDVAPGAAIVLAATACFFIAWALRGALRMRTRAT